MFDLIAAWFAVGMFLAGAWIVFDAVTGGGTRRPGTATATAVVTRARRERRPPAT